MILLNSCDDEPEASNTYLLPEFWNNLTETELDSAATVDKLKGNWKLTYRYCCSESTTDGALINVEDEERYQLSFGSEKIFVFYNGGQRQESEWSLQTENPSAFRIESYPYVTNTRGQIIFADNMLLFYNSPNDGADHYYERMN